jgi:hypothetical protein
VYDRFSIPARLPIAPGNKFQALGVDSSVDGSPISPLLAFYIDDETTVLPQSLLWRQRLTICTALFVQSGALAAAVGYLVAAATLVLTSSVVWTWSFGKHEGFSREKTWRILLVQMFTVVLTTGFLLYLRKTGFGAFGIPSGQHSRRGSAPEHERGKPGHESAKGTVAELNDAYAGVVLWPKKQVHTKLVAPAPISWERNLSSGQPTKPLIIPFEGVYWFFRTPDAEPPKNSHEARGSPEIFDIRSTGRRPLSMEARQNLGTFMNLGCCGKIQIAIRNADRYPESVSLELILINTSLPGKPSQSLGRATINSTRPWKLYDDRPPTTETLNFPIPSKNAIQRFDEVKIVFRLDAERADAAAKIGIDHFTLIPRGL